MHLGKRQVFFRLGPQQAAVYLSLLDFNAYPAGQKIYPAAGPQPGLVEMCIRDRAKVIATGGMALLVSGETDIDVLDGVLTLKGLRILYEKNA